MGNSVSITNNESNETNISNDSNVLSEQEIIELFENEDIMKHIHEKNKGDICQSIFVAMHDKKIIKKMQDEWLKRQKEQN